VSVCIQHRREVRLGLLHQTLLRKAVPRRDRHRTRFHVELFAEERYILRCVKKVHEPRTRAQQLDRCLPNSDATSLRGGRRFRKLVSAEDLSNHWHFNCQAQREQWYRFACYDDLAHDEHINRSREEGGFVA
jgi:hypothetical protein